MANEIMQAIEAVGKSFAELKDTNERMLAEERAGNEARAKELKSALDKISDDLGSNVKAREIAEKRLATMQDRLEIIEALNDRPGKTVQDRIRSEHKDIFMRWFRSGGKDASAEHQYKELVAKYREVKDVSLTDAAGGFALPEEISRSIDNLVLKLSAIAANVKNVQAGTSDYKELISVNDSTSAWTAETDSRTGTAEPTLRNRVPTWGELYAYMQASNWSLEDLFFNVENWLVENAAARFRRGSRDGDLQRQRQRQADGHVRGGPDDRGRLRVARAGARDARVYPAVQPVLAVHLDRPHGKDVGGPRVPAPRALSQQCEVRDELGHAGPRPQAHGHHGAVPVASVAAGGPAGSAARLRAVHLGGSRQPDVG